MQLPTIRGIVTVNFYLIFSLNIYYLNSVFSYISPFPRCQSLTDDVSAQCACWINQTIVIDKIKEFKCQVKSNQKLVTQFKVKSRRNITSQEINDLINNIFINILYLLIE